MAFFVPKELIDFFNENQWVEFSGVLNADQAAKLASSCKSVLASRASSKGQDFIRLSSQEAYSLGRDTWRQNQDIKNLVHRTDIAKAASQLFQQDSFRLGADQVFFVPSIPKTHEGLSWNIEKTLQDMFCFQGVFGAILYPLRGESETQEELGDLAESQTSSYNLFHVPVGNAVMLGKEALLRFLPQCLGPGSTYLMLALVKMDAVYSCNMEDPNHTYLKQFSYTYGDRLRGDTHPTLCRKI